MNTSETWRNSVALEFMSHSLKVFSIVDVQAFIIDLGHVTHASCSSPQLIFVQNMLKCITIFLCLEFDFSNAGVCSLACSCIILSYQNDEKKMTDETTQINKC